MKRIFCLLLATLICFGSFGFTAFADVAAVTYTLTVTDNQNGTYYVVATVPEGISFGKLVISVSDSLSLVSGSLSSVPGAATNEAYSREGVEGACVSFALTSAMPAGTAVFTATYTATEGAQVSLADFSAPEWFIGADYEKAADQTSGDINYVFTTAEAPSSEDISTDSSEPSSEDSSADAVSATYTVTTTDNGDGTCTVTAAVYGGVSSVKLVITVDSNLTLIPGSLSSLPSATINESYNRGGVTGACVSFAAFAPLADGTVVFTASYTATEGVTLNGSEVRSNEWNLGINGEKVADQTTGTITYAYVPHTHTYDNDCDTECNICFLPRAIEHNYSTEWTSDSTQHWHECSCGDKTDIDTHTYDNDCDTDCNVCFLPRAIEHNYSTEWTSDSTQHWHECACGDKTDVDTHSYDNDCDTDCNICFLPRVIEHNYSTEWTSDSVSHWHQCACGDKADIDTHIYDNDCDTDCNICFEPRQIQHNYSTEWTSDSTQHWHECACGDKTDIDTHSYDNILDADCNTCDEVRELSAIKGDVNDDGYVDNMDASAILKYDAGILPSI